VMELLVLFGLVRLADCIFSGETAWFVGSVRVVGSVRFVVAWFVGSVRDTSHMTVGRVFWISSSTVALIGDSSLLALSFFGT